MTVVWALATKTDGMASAIRMNATRAIGVRLQDLEEVGMEVATADPTATAAIVGRVGGPELGDACRAVRVVLVGRRVSMGVVVRLPSLHTELICKWSITYLVLVHLFQQNGGRVIAVDCFSSGS